MPPQEVTAWKWLRNGDEAFAAMLAAIDAARISVCLETYIFVGDALGQRFLDSLVRAQQRGASVQVLVDSYGSLNLADVFWKPLREAGGEARFFNPLTLKRFGIRNHRKLLVCDDSLAILGGFNLGTTFAGDGVTNGWCDLGMQLEGPLVPDLATSFRGMFALAEFRHKRFARLSRARLKRALGGDGAQILLSGPGRGRNPIRRAMVADLKHARNVQLIVAYFLPTGNLRRALHRAARRSKSLQIILAGKSDVPPSQLAAQSLYRRLLKSGAQIFEYQPQILHAKLFIVDDVVYVGSANLDPRSLGINYEVMLRLQNAKMAAEARDLFAQTLRHCERVELEAWITKRSFWTRLKCRWSHFVLSRVDPYLARRQWKGLPD